MAEYDPEVIHTFADRLYARANAIIMEYFAIGVVLCGGGAFLGAWVIGIDPRAGLVIGAVVGGLIGFALGREKAFALKLAAQTALCQVQIEENTRPAGE